MIQRIQSLFLLAATILQVLYIKASLAEFLMNNNDSYKFTSAGIKNLSDNSLVQNTSALLILSVFIVIITFFAIFLYKKRILQIRFCIYSMLLNIGQVGLFLYLYFNFKNNNPVTSGTYELAAVIPVASIILLFLAFRGIRKDEILIKAYDRLR
ncbi:MAG: DUF4293 domain-containing protein [Bacteroidales bacterium]|nr:DUF4293 domain-containing protein [Bacteroidales bacterium]MBN2819647.1 DUF4293 domain-containing protein [Bacteroidales bacterium]